MRRALMDKSFVGEFLQERDSGQALPNWIEKEEQQGREVACGSQPAFDALYFPLLAAAVIFKECSSPGRRSPPAPAKLRGSVYACQ